MKFSITSLLLFFSLFVFGQPGNTPGSVAMGNNIIGCDTITGQKVFYDIRNNNVCDCLGVDGDILIDRSCENVVPGDCSPVDTILNCAKWSSDVVFLDNTFTNFANDYEFTLTLEDGTETTINIPSSAGWTQQVDAITAAVGAAFPDAVAESRCNTPTGCGGLLPPPSDAQPSKSIVARYTSIIFCPTDNAIVGAKITGLNGEAVKGKDLVLEIIRTKEKRGWACKVKGQPVVLQDEDCKPVPAADLPACWFECSESIQEPPQTTCEFANILAFDCYENPDYDFENNPTVEEFLSNPIIIVVATCPDGTTISYQVEEDGALIDYNEGNGLIGFIRDANCEAEELPTCRPEGEYTGRTLCYEKKGKLVLIEKQFDNTLTGSQTVDVSASLGLAAGSVIATIDNQLWTGGNADIIATSTTNDATFSVSGTQDVCIKVQHGGSIPTDGGSDCFVSNDGVLYSFTGNITGDGSVTEGVQGCVTSVTDNSQGAINWTSDGAATNVTATTTNLNAFNSVRFWVATYEFSELKEYVSEDGKYCAWFDGKTEIDLSTVDLVDCEKDNEIVEDECTTTTVTGCVDGQTVLLTIETCAQDTTGLNCGAIGETIIWNADDFEGKVGISTLPTNWEQLLATGNKSNASGQTQATSDVANATGPSAAGILGVSACGDTHVQSLIGGQGASVYSEGLKRTATSLTVGTQYCLDFSQAVSNQTNGCFSSGGWEFCLDDNLATSQQSAETVDANQEAFPTNPNLVWESRQICFTATATSHEINLRPWTTDTDYTCNNWLGRMAIDCIQLSEVAGGATTDECSCTKITCITNPTTGENYDIEDVSLVPCGTNDVCFDTEISSDLVCVIVDGNDFYAFAVNEILSDCNTGQQVGQNNYFTDLLGNSYPAEKVELSEDCEGEIIEGKVCVDGVTLNTLIIDGVTTYYDLGGNPVAAPKKVDYVGECIEAISIIKGCAEYLGDEVKGYIHLGDGGNYFTDFNGNILSGATPFCCDDCIQWFGCRDGRLAMPIGSVVTMGNGDILNISGLRYTQIAQLIVDTYGGSFEAPSLGGPQGPNFSQCQGSSQHELQFFNVPKIESIDDWKLSGTAGNCDFSEPVTTGMYEFCVNGLPVVYCIEGKEIKFYQNGTELINPQFHKCDCQPDQK